MQWMMLQSSNTQVVDENTVCLMSYPILTWGYPGNLRYSMATVQLPFGLPTFVRDTLYANALELQRELE